MRAASLFERAMGERFWQLDPAVQRFHRLQGRHCLAGEVTTRAPASRLAWLLALCLGAPRHAGRGPIRFELDAAPAVETWTRHFPGRTMRSRLSADPDGVAEVLGPLHLSFALTARDGALEMRLTRLALWRIVCPRRLMPRVQARESGDAGRLNFTVEAALPAIGLVARYEGHLALAGQVPS